MNTLLKTAQENLSIIAVRLRKSEAELGEHLRPEDFNDLPLSSQSFQGVQAIATGIGRRMTRIPKMTATPMALLW